MVFYTHSSTINSSENGIHNIVIPYKVIDKRWYKDLLLGLQINSVKIILLGYLLTLPFIDY